MYHENELSVINRELLEKRKTRPLVSSFNNIFKVSDILFHKYYESKLKTTNFTIISNNCWGGVMYEHFGIQKQSPTIGSYFYADDYLKFVSNLNYYLNVKLEMIPLEESKWYEILKLKHQEKVPIGRLNDVEIIFLHYKSEREALEKWCRRLDRVNFDNLIIKFSEQNLCEYRHLQLFDELPYCRKIMFVKNAHPEFESSIKLPFYDNSVSLLSDIHEYSFKMHEIKKRLYL